MYLHKFSVVFVPHSYRYTLDDLFPMMNAVKQRAELYDHWASLVTETLEAKLEKKKGKQQEQIRNIKGPLPVVLHLLKPSIYAAIFKLL